MKWLIIAVIILAQQAAESPKSKGAAEPSQAQAAASAKNTDTNRKKAARSAPVPAQPSTVVESKGDTATSSNGTQTNNRQASEEGWATQRKLTWFTGLLAVVGVLQLIVTFLT
jgi:hypothetical protein